MPILENIECPSRVVEWVRDTLVGRGMIGGVDTDGTSPTDREVSSVHAAIYWKRRTRTWHVQDLGSANGTTVDGNRVAPGESAVLSEGTILALGGSKWRVRQADPPSTMAASAGELRVATNDVLLLPDEGKPRVALIREGGVWRARAYAEFETGGGRVIEHGATLLVEGRTWRIAHSEGADLRTVPTVGCLADHQLTLQVPRRMENILPTFTKGEHSISLPPRRHHELWWLLAEACLEHQEQGVADDEVGWVETDTLVRDLGLASDPGYLNVLVHRARNQVARAGFTDFAEIVQRRKVPQPAMRLGVRRVEVIRVD